jgi:hypothetical protein
MVKCLTAPCPRPVACVTLRHQVKARAGHARSSSQWQAVNLGPCHFWVTVVPLQPEMSNIAMRVAHRCKQGIRLERMSDKDVLCRRWLTQATKTSTNSSFSASRRCERRWQLTNANTSSNKLNTTLMPHSITHGDACFAYFNKIRGIPAGVRWSWSRSCSIFLRASLAFDAGGPKRAITFGGASEPFPMTAVRLVLRIAILLTAGLSSAASWAAAPLPPSVLILDRSDADSPWYADFSASFRSTLNAGSERRFSVYSEHLDLSRFPGTQHHEVLRTYLQNKYRDRPIGVLVAQGSSALEFVMRSRAELWPAVPVIFAAVDEETAAQLNLPSDVTGTIYQLPFRNMVAAAQALVPNLKRIALVGDSWERQAVRPHYQEQIPAFAAQFEFIDLIGLPMTEIRKRVAVLPDDTAIIYTGLMLEGAGPHEGLAAFASVANRPIVIDAETSIGYGGTGGSPSARAEPADGCCSRGSSSRS